MCFDTVILKAPARRSGPACEWSAQNPEENTHRPKQDSSQKGGPDTKDIRVVPFPLYQTLTDRQNHHKTLVTCIQPWPLEREWDGLWYLSGSW